MPKIYALSIVTFTISAGCLSANVFNLFFPYSFGILYGILFILGSLYCAIKRKYALAYFLYSLSVCTKYEFIFLLPLLIWNSGAKDWKKSLAAFLTPILITFGFLFFQGVTIIDLILSAKIMLAMSSAKTLHWFYSVTGLVFRPQIILIYLFNILKYLIPMIFLYFFRNIWSAVVVCLYLWFSVNQEILIYAFPLILLLLLIRFKQLKNYQRFVVIASFLISAKVFFALTLESYGIYFIPFALISLFITIPNKYKKQILVLIFCASLVLGIKNMFLILKKDLEIQTDRGIVYTNEYYGKNFSELIRFIEKNSQKSDTVLVLPEGLSVNFLTGRPSDNKFYSQIPLYIETFGENLIIERIKRFPPRYIAITEYDTSNYYYSFFGKDYAKEIVKHIRKNYVLEKVFNDGIRIEIYKAKNKI